MFHPPSHHPVGESCIPSLGPWGWRNRQCPTVERLTALYQSRYLQPGWRGNCILWMAIQGLCSVTEGKTGGRGVRFCRRDGGSVPQSYGKTSLSCLKHSVGWQELKITAQEYAGSVPGSLGKGSPFHEVPKGLSPGNRVMRGTWS